MYVVDEKGERVDGEDTYLRRNIFGMGTQLDMLAKYDMVYDSVGYPKVDWPDYPGHEHFNGDGDPVTEAGRVYDMAIAAHLKATYDERPGLPAHKFSTNDGWWVTPAECLSAIQLWVKAGRPVVDDFGRGDGPYNDVIPFLQKGAENGGFRVW